MRSCYQITVLLSFASLHGSCLTPPAFPQSALYPLFFSPPPSIPSLFSPTCGKHYILSGGEGEQTSQADTESLSGRCSGAAGRQLGNCMAVTLSLALSLGPDAVWTKGGLVISEPQHPIADRLHPPTALDWTGPRLNGGEGDKGRPS